MACVKDQPKEDYANVWAAGVVSASLDDVVRTFGHGSRKRERHGQSLVNLDNALRSCGIRAKLWLGGSFVTAKPDPADIDAVIWPAGHIFTADNLERASHVLRHKLLRNNFGMDVHIEPISNDEMFERELHYLGFYGYGWDRRTPRTIVEVMIGSAAASCTADPHQK